MGVVLRPCAGSHEWPELVRIWRSAVEATHHFLTPDQVDGFAGRFASDYFPHVELTVAEVDGRPVGFSGIADDRLEMLFVAQDARGHGVGTVLLDAALVRIPRLLVDVNEQNEQAVGFYEHRGFVRLGRSATDPDGSPFPILHLGRPGG